MKAMLLEDAVKLKFDDIRMPPCPEGGAVVRVEACGICRTDVKCYFQGQRDLKMPRILGHEMAGVVLEIDAMVQNLEPGSHVQVYPGLSCGDCDYCRQGNNNMCDNLQIMGFNYDGGFSGYLTVPAAGVAAGVLHPIPAGLSFSEASMTEPLACCINMLEILEIKAGEHILIYGAGRFGLLTAMLARLSAPGRVIILEPNETRRIYAHRHGFKQTYDPRPSRLPEILHDLTGGRGVDLAVTCNPLEESFNSAIATLRKRGRLGFFSGLVGTGLTNLNLNLIHYKELTVKGAYGCSIRHNQAALDLLGSKTIEVQDLITREIALADLKDGLLMVKNQSEISIVITEFQGGI